VIKRMNMKKIRSKKALKFLGLLISAMLIATVSAVTYRYLYIDGSITIGAQYMSWIAGTDAPDASISGTTAIVDFDVEQGTPINFTEALFLKNNNNTGHFHCNVSVTTAVLPADFQEAKMHIYQNWTGSWTWITTLDLTSTASVYPNGQLNGTKYLRMGFEINATASGGIKPFDIEVEYWA